MKWTRACVVLGALLLALTPSLWSEELQRVETLNVEGVVQQLRSLPSPMPAPLPLPAAAWAAPDPTEVQRRELYNRLLVLYPASVQELARALHDPDVAQRRSVAQALAVLSGGWWRFNGERHTVDIVAAMPALIAALDDADSLVRSWSAENLGNIGPRAVMAVPALVRLLGSDDVAVRNGAYTGLRHIGPPALPALRKALSAEMADVRYFAAKAIKGIAEGEK